MNKLKIVDHIKSDNNINNRSMSEGTGAKFLKDVPLYEEHQNEQLEKRNNRGSNSE